MFYQCWLILIERPQTLYTLLFAKRAVLVYYELILSKTPFTIDDVSV